MCRATALGEVAVELDPVDVHHEAPPEYAVTVTGIDRLAHDVIGLTLRLPDESTMSYLAGQYLNVILDDGERRSYSFTSASDSTNLIYLHIRQVPGGRFTSQVFDSMKTGNALRIEGPLGEFVLREPSDRPIIFVAGATGFAPVKSLLEEAFSRGIGRPLHLYWGVRSRRDLYMADLPERWA